MGAALAAQDGTSTLHIYTSLEGPTFTVDGQIYRHSGVFRWPADSKHTVATEPLQYDPSRLGVRYLFGGWVTAQRALEWPYTYITVTADPAMSFLRLNFRMEYRLSLRFTSCGEGGCTAPGLVIVNGVHYTSNADIWLPADSAVTVLVQPNPGFVFTGFQDIPDGMNDGFVNSFVLNQPTILAPKFNVARPVQLRTEPAGLRVMADRDPVVTPITMNWAHGSVHTLGPVSPQIDLWGKTWVFRSWSNDQPAVHAYTVAVMSSPDTVTATYVPGARVSFKTNPVGLNLRVDGRDDWPSGNFTWGAGETHTVEAPAWRKDAQGRNCRFLGWSNGGPAAQEITVGDEHVRGYTLIANYEVQAGVTLRSSEPGVTFTVDGEECPGPCAIERRPGTEIQFAAPLEAVPAEGVRLEFAGWSDGGPRERALTPTTDLQTLVALYRVMVRLAAVSDPPEAAAWHFNPGSPDGYYEARSDVIVYVEPRPGYRFRKFEGDLAGSLPYGKLRMTAPRTVRALFQAAPQAGEAVVLNAAGETPAAVVAPGSVISIYGTGLAGAALAGPENPLTQTLGGVTVRVGDRLLPLFFVSPEQINAQLPPDLDLGTRRVAVKWEGKPEVEGSFEVARHAPGLFQQVVEDRSYAALARADGSAVAAGSPARRGEVVTIYGTGFGPYDPAPLAGFAAPADPLCRLLAPVVLVAGESEWEAIEAFAAPGRTGIDALRFRIPEDAPPGPIELRVRVGDAESNAVLLTIE